MNNGLRVTGTFPIRDVEARFDLSVDSQGIDLDLAYDPKHPVLEGLTQGLAVLAISALAIKGAMHAYNSLRTANND